jgi:hypothetical protein
MLGYAIVGPVIALLISLKFTDGRYKAHQKEYEELLTKVALLEKRNEAVDKEMLQKIMTTVMPIAKAVNKLNQEVGL